MLGTILFALFIIAFIGFFVLSFVMGAYKQYLELKILKNLGNLQSSEIIEALKNLKK